MNLPVIEVEYALPEMQASELLDGFVGEELYENFRHDNTATSTNIRSVEQAKQRGYKISYFGRWSNGTRKGYITCPKCRERALLSMSDVKSRCGWIDGKI